MFFKEAHLKHAFSSLNTTQRMTRHGVSMEESRDIHWPIMPAYPESVSSSIDNTDTYLGTQRKIIGMAGNGTPGHCGSSVLQLRDLCHGHTSTVEDLKIAFVGQKSKNRAVQGNEPRMHKFPLNCRFKRRKEACDSRGSQLQNGDGDGDDFVSKMELKN